MHRRDGGRCGICGGDLSQHGAWIDYVAPKRFAYFDTRDGKAIDGMRWKSKLAHPDNLQAVHSYCYRRKAKTANVSAWRHPTMPTLQVAVGRRERVLSVPVAARGSDRGGMLGASRDLVLGLAMIPLAILGLSVIPFVMRFVMGFLL